MLKLKIALVAGTLAIAMSGCAKPASDSEPIPNETITNSVAADVAPANDTMAIANDNATDSLATAETATNATNSADEDQTSSGGVVLK